MSSFFERTDRTSVGRARLSADAEKLRTLATEKRSPRVLIEVSIEEVYLHCAKALMRSGLWAEESRRERSILPTLGEMIADQTGSTAAPESQAEML